MLRPPARWRRAYYLRGLLTKSAAPSGETHVSVMWVHGVTPSAPGSSLRPSTCAAPVVNRQGLVATRCAGRLC